MQITFLPNIGKIRNRVVSGLFRAFTFSLLILSVSSLHAQTVAYVANFGDLFPFNDGTVSVVDTSTNTVTATITTGGTPNGVTISPDGTRAYVTDLNGGRVFVIDTASNTVIATVVFSGRFSFPAFPAITPDGKNLYVSDGGHNRVLVISTATNSVVATIDFLGSGLISPDAEVITPDGAHVYVVAEDLNGNGFVAVIDTASNTIVQSIPVNSDAASQLTSSMVVTPGGGNVYVAGVNDPDVQVISTASNTVGTTIPFSGTSTGLAITPDGSKIYVSDKFANVVNIIDVATNTVEPTTIPVGAFAFGVAITPDGAFVYVTNLEDNTVSVISTATNTVVATIPVGTAPGGIAIAPLNAPFASFPAPTPSNIGNPNRISLSGSLSLGANSALDFAHQPMTLTVGGFSLLFPAGTVTQVGNAAQQHFTFSGTLNGLSVTFDLIGTSPNFTYTFNIMSKNVGTQIGPNPVTVSLAIGNNSGSTTVNF